MKEIKVKKKQSAMDITVLGYGNPEAYFKLHVDNGLTQIPAQLVEGQALSIDEESDLLDKLNLKVLNEQILPIATNPE